MWTAIILVCINVARPVLRPLSLVSNGDDQYLRVSCPVNNLKRESRQRPSACVF